LGPRNTISEKIIARRQLHSSVHDGRSGVTLLETAKDQGQRSALAKKRRFRGRCQGREFQPIRKITGAKKKATRAAAGRPFPREGRRGRRGGGECTPPSETDHKLKETLTGELEPADREKWVWGEGGGTQTGCRSHGVKGPSARPSSLGHWGETTEKKTPLCWKKQLGQQAQRQKKEVSEEGGSERRKSTTQPIPSSTDFDT